VTHSIRHTTTTTTTITYYYYYYYYYYHNNNNYYYYYYYYPPTAVRLRYGASAALSPFCRKRVLSGISPINSWTMMRSLLTARRKPKAVPWGALREACGG